MRGGKGGGVGGSLLKIGRQERLLLRRVLDKRDLGDVKSSCNKCQVLDWILVSVCVQIKKDLKGNKTS